MGLKFDPFFPFTEGTNGRFQNPGTSFMKSLRSPIPLRVIAVGDAVLRRPRPWGPSPCPEVLGSRQKAQRGLVSCLPPGTSVPPEQASHPEGVTGLKIEGVSMAPGTCRLETSRAEQPHGRGPPLQNSCWVPGSPAAAGLSPCLPSVRPARGQKLGEYVSFHEDEMATA